MNNKDNIQLQPEKEFSFITFYFKLFEHRWLIILLIVLGVIAGAAFTKFTYKENYIVSTSMLLQPPRKVSDSKDYLGSIQTKDMLNNTYSVVLNSNDFLKSIVLSDYNIPENGNKIKANLLKYFKTDDISIAIDTVKSMVNIRCDKRTGVLVLEYTSTYPDIAAQILNNIVAQINTFYNYRFNSNSMRNLEFVEKSIASGKKELDEAKNNLATFIERNKQLKIALKNRDQYPEYYQCIEAMEKLQENVELKRKSYSVLLTKSESLKLEISENAPYVTLIESAAVPLKPIPGKYARNGILGGLLGLALATVYIILCNFILVFNLYGTPMENIPSELKKDFKRFSNTFTSKK